MMWPFDKNTKGRQQPKESELAREAAKASLRESIQDRAEVQVVHKAVQHELATNHISKRITIMLREGE